MTPGYPSTSGLLLLAFVTFGTLLAHALFLVWLVMRLLRYRPVWKALAITVASAVMPLVSFYAVLAADLRAGRVRLTGSAARATVFIAAALILCFAIGLSAESHYVAADRRLAGVPQTAALAFVYYLVALSVFYIPPYVLGLRMRLPPASNAQIGAIAVLLVMLSAAA
ncbi:MAG: hypothetical protein DI498_09105 [Paracoccus denitrificans]|nr:MAG: hypothetical protein DI498_09105 [Paracoccus denitrificans]PZO84037.1 MAG: hypothetical protein DI633_09105 [Paracoccus denitrificans]